MSGPSTAILSDHDNRMFPRQQRLGEMVKCAIPRDIRHRLSIDDQCGARFRAAADFHRMAHQLRILDLQQHVLSFALS